MVMATKPIRSRTVPYWLRFDRCTPGCGAAAGEPCFDRRGRAAPMTTGSRRKATACKGRPLRAATGLVPGIPAVADLEGRGGQVTQPLDPDVVHELGVMHAEDRGQW